MPFGDHRARVQGNTEPSVELGTGVCLAPGPQLAHRMRQYDDIYFQRNHHAAGQQYRGVSTGHTWQRRNTYIVTCALDATTASYFFSSSATRSDGGRTPDVRSTLIFLAPWYPPEGRHALSVEICTAQPPGRLAGPSGWIQNAVLNRQGSTWSDRRLRLQVFYWTSLGPRSPTSTNVQSTYPGINSHI
jgi:hypothetical protein